MNGDGTVATTLSATPSPSASNTAFVISSTNSGMPSVRSIMKLAQVAVPLTNDLFQDWPRLLTPPTPRQMIVVRQMGREQRWLWKLGGLNGENPEQWRPGVLKLGR